MWGPGAEYQSGELGVADPSRLYLETALTPRDSVTWYDIKEPAQSQRAP